jgi:diguanylate cyclase (GGDEF)-like protein/PAS domain S-box-containing protein
MPAAPLPADDVQRLAALHSLRVMDTPPHAQFDALVQAAAAICGTPIALITLVDEHRVWIKANYGLEGVTESPRHLSFCGYTILENRVLEVPDATADPRFADLGTAESGICFYAGAPLTLSDGMNIGTLCVIDRAARRLTAAQHELLGHLAHAASAMLEQFDATARLTRTLQALQASQLNIQQVYEMTPAMMHSIDAQGRMLVVSDTWLQRLGYTREEVIGRHYSEFVSPDSLRHANTEIMPALFREGRYDKLDFQLRAKDGEVLDTLISSRLIRDAAGNPVRNLTVTEDVTLQKRAERALEEQRQRLEYVIEATRVGTWEWHIPSGAQRLNERWAQKLGRTLEELGQTTIQTWVALVHPEDLVATLAAFDRHVRGETDYFEAECRMQHRDGHYLWVMLRGAVMVRTAQGAPEWMFGTMADISLRKRHELALAEAQEFLELTSQAAEIGGWSVDIASGQFIWTAETRRIHGVTADYQPTVESAIGFYTPEAQPIIRAAVERALEAGEKFDLELRFIRATGEVIWVQSIGIPIFKEGRVVRLVGSIKEVTKRVMEHQALQQTQERLALATDSGRIGTFDWNIETDVKFWDPWVFRLYGLPISDEPVSHEQWSSLIHPDDRARAQEEVRLAIAGIQPYDTEFRIIWPDGCIRHIRAAATVTRNAAGKAIRMTGADWDVTEMRRLAADLAKQHELLRITLQSIGDGVITTEPDGRVTWMNPAAERLTGWTVAEAQGRALDEVFKIFNEQTREPAENPVALCLAENKIVGLANHTLLIGRDGTEYGIEDSAAPIRSASGETLGVVLVFHDVTEARQLSGEMSYRATHDALTGLLNRAEFEVRLRFLLHKAHSDRSSNAMLFIDLDQFKLVNDTCGHAAGDLLLQQVAKLLSELVRAADTVARLGGDEFAIIFEHCTIEQATPLAQKICDRMEDFRFTADGQRFRIGASIGLVPVDHRWPTVATLLQAADSSCYAAKEAGRNRVHIWFDTDNAMRARQGESQWASRLATALDEDSFTLYAQRIHNLQGNEAGVHAEVLLRMIENNGTLSAPGAFLPAAERFHIASRIDRWVLRKAIDWMMSVDEITRIDTLCVNLSGQSIGDRAFHRWAIAMLADAGPRICQRLCLEITETAAVTNLADAATFIEQVRAVGVRVALDDFGAGASSFGYLKTMPVDFLKIDGQFVRDLTTDTLDEAAVRCFADVASVVGMQTVAEFVDDAGVMSKLRDMGINFAQGFLIHRPAPIEELLGQ